MLANKYYLKGLFNGSRSDNVARIQVGTNFNLDNTICVLYYLCIGDIPWARANHDTVKKARRIPHLYKVVQKLSFVMIEVHF